MAGELQETSGSSVLNMVLGLDIFEILLTYGAFRSKVRKLTRNQNISSVL